MKEQVFYGIEAYMARKKVEECILSTFLVTNYISTYLYIYIFTYLHIYISTYLHTCLDIDMSSHLYIYISTYLRTRSWKVGTLASWRFWPRTRIISTRIRSKFDLVLPSSTSLKHLPLPLMITITIIITITNTIIDYHYPFPITSTLTRSKFGPLLPSSTTLKPLRSPLAITSIWILSNFVLVYQEPRYCVIPIVSGS